MRISSLSPLPMISRAPRDSQNNFPHVHGYHIRSNSNTITQTHIRIAYTHKYAPLHTLLTLAMLYFSVSYAFSLANLSVYCVMIMKTCASYLYYDCILAQYDSDLKCGAAVCIFFLYSFLWAFFLLVALLLPPTLYYCIYCGECCASHPIHAYCGNDDREKTESIYVWLGLHIAWNQIEYQPNWM